MKRDKIILTDCDGVLLNWNSEFEKYLANIGIPRVPNTDHEYSMTSRHNITMQEAIEHIHNFNTSDAIKHLPPFADSVEYVTRLADEGFRFIIVTSVSDHPTARVNRMHNVQDVFGDIFTEVHCLESGASKAHVLMNWADTKYFWIEDHTRQAEAGYEAGLRPILIDHPYNSHFFTDLFPRVSYSTPWKEIYKIISEDYQNI